MLSSASSEITTASQGLERSLTSRLEGVPSIQWFGDRYDDKGTCDTSGPSQVEAELTLLQLVVEFTVE